MAEPTPRKLLSLVSIAALLDCSKASVRRRSLSDPTFPTLRVINNRLFAFADELAQWIEETPTEAKKPVRFQTRCVEEEAEARAK
jgi:hypothetical protein